MEEAEPLIDPSLLANLSPSEREEALAAAAAAKRAEERAAKRAALSQPSSAPSAVPTPTNTTAANNNNNNNNEEEEEEAKAIELALQQKQKERMEQRKKEEERRRAILTSRGKRGILSNHGKGEEEDGGVRFVSKKQRLELKSDSTTNKTNGNGNSNGNGNGNGSSNSYGTKSTKPSSSSSSSSTNQSSRKTQQTTHTLSTAERDYIKQAYLGKSATSSYSSNQLNDKQLQAQKARKQKKKITFKFEWDDEEDTTLNDIPQVLPVPTNSSNRNRNSSTSSRDYRNNRNGANNRNQRSTSSTNRNNNNNSFSASFRGTVLDVQTKPLSKMTQRDWRILRENYDISIRGGKCPPPLRSFTESPLPNSIPTIHPSLLEAIRTVCKYKEPSPIQRQTIPIGMQRRDVIGVAETGSGKTAAFGIPLLHHVLSLPKDILESVAEQGPLALVLGPTRELALQIHVEFQKLLSCQSTSSTRKGSSSSSRRNATTATTTLVKAASIVGGQSIQNQAMELRQGVHVVVGTPGRINDCIENAYLVLNQCNMIILDEADRMIDLGFAPQIETILDSMGGLLKSEVEKEAYEQEQLDLGQLNSKDRKEKEKGNKRCKYRLTAMFSATMPPEVQRIAKAYLRHPAIVSVGDDDSGKNQRIEQKVLFLSSVAQKERALKDVILRQTISSDKVIVFVNEKKHTEAVGRIVERMGRRCVVLHGGKSQEQREENLDLFRRGGVVMVATDVAGRGLDIPMVKHIINYDLPTRSIDNYCHRIGRTGRAGNKGVATSFVTDEDEGIMAPLKAYLESTGSHVPDRLARHPAAGSGAPGGNLIR